MRIAVPIDEKDSKSVSISFGRAQYFLIYDTETKESVILDNGVATSASGGAGILAAQFLVDNRVSALITPRCGQNAANVLEAAGVKVYKTTGTSVNDNIDAFRTETLPKS
ncbi:MAG: NifB/NifX family molybdenum-iron cluster-binding protein [Bacillota bacterium]|jgi:predicted Fe-Mo cluster-binding NifX family protein